MTYPHKSGSSGRARRTPDEQLAGPQLIAEAYRGIRPAPGYPACPDHTEKQALFANVIDDGDAFGAMITDTDIKNLLRNKANWHPPPLIFSRYGASVTNLYHL